MTTKYNWLLTSSSALAILFNLFYHRLEIQIFKFDNSVSPELCCLTSRRLVKILLEVILMILHPNKLYGRSCASFYHYPSLYFVMILRIVPFCRVLILESLIFGNTKTETVATLRLVNKIYKSSSRVDVFYSARLGFSKPFFSLDSMNFGCLNDASIRLIIRHYMDSASGQILTIVCCLNWILVAECLRLAEARQAVITTKLDAFDYDFMDMFWLVPITLFTIGYGDFYPKTGYGRTFCLWLGLSGTIASALLVTLMTAKLTMTRRERLLHKVLNSDNIKKELKHKAAIVLQRTYRRHLKGYDVLKRPECQGHISIDNLGEDVAAIVAHHRKHCSIGTSKSTSQQITQHVSNLGQVNNIITSENSSHENDININHENSQENNVRSNSNTSSNTCPTASTLENNTDLTSGLGSSQTQTANTHHHVPPIYIHQNRPMSQHNSKHNMMMLTRSNREEYEISNLQNSETQRHINYLADDKRCCAHQKFCKNYEESLNVSRASTSSEHQQGRTMRPLGRGRKLFGLPIRLSS